MLNFLLFPCRFYFFTGQGNFFGDTTAALSRAPSPFLSSRKQFFFVLPLLATFVQKIMSPTLTLLLLSIEQLHSGGKGKKEEKGA
jgi:hypothetical protein